MARAALAGVLVLVAQAAFAAGLVGVGRILPESHLTAFREQWSAVRRHAVADALRPGALPSGATASVLYTITHHALPGYKSIDLAGLGLKSGWAKSAVSEAPTVRPVHGASESVFKSTDFGGLALKPGWAKSTVVEAPAVTPVQGARDSVLGFLAEAPSQQPDPAAPPATASTLDMNALTQLLAETQRDIADREAQVRLREQLMAGASRYVVLGVERNADPSIPGIYRVHIPGSPAHPVNTTLAIAQIAREVATEAGVDRAFIDYRGFDKAESEALTASMGWQVPLFGVRVQAAGENAAWLEPIPAGGSRWIAPGVPTVTVDALGTAWHRTPFALYFPGRAVFLAVVSRVRFHCQALIERLNAWLGSEAAVGVSTAVLVEWALTDVQSSQGLTDEQLRGILVYDVGGTQVSLGNSGCCGAPSRRATESIVLAAATAVSGLSGKRPRIALPDGTGDHAFVGELADRREDR